MYFLRCTIAYKNQTTRNGIYLQRRFIPKLMGNIVCVCVCLRFFPPKEKGMVVYRVHANAHNEHGHYIDGYTSDSN